jgi:hypothetical protein
MVSGRKHVLEPFVIDRTLAPAHWLVFNEVEVPMFLRQNLVAVVGHASPGRVTLLPKLDRAVLRLPLGSPSPSIICKQGHGGANDLVAEGRGTDTERLVDELSRLELGPDGGTIISEVMGGGSFELNDACVCHDVNRIRHRIRHRVMIGRFHR